MVEGWGRWVDLVGDHRDLAISRRGNGLAHGRGIYSWEGSRLENSGVRPKAWVVVWWTVRQEGHSGCLEEG